MWLPALPARSHGALLQKRSDNNRTIWMIAIIAIVIFSILLLTYLLTIKLRRGVPKAKSQKNKLPSSVFSLNIFRRGPNRNDYSTNLQDNGTGRNSSAGGSRGREMSGSAAPLDPERQSLNQNNTTGVDRNTSVRSVMTLPAYAPAPRENEQVLGREGERGGIDTVVEFPEDDGEEESRREGEMESLYQIRLARRAEAREREQRRQERREARQRGDVEALNEIRRRAERAAEESVSQMLIANHQAANRDRRVSSVQYGDLGLARHDGTRIRGNSTDSDNRPLLDSAASFSGQSGGRDRGLSNATLDTGHHRGLSASSMRTVSSRASDDYDFADPARSSHQGSNEDFEVISLSQPNSRSLSRTATPQNVPSVEIPNEQAPAYEDPPIYESPVTTRAPMLPALERLPSIQITPEPTPLNQVHTPPSR